MKFDVGTKFEPFLQSNMCISVYYTAGWYTFLDNLSKKFGSQVNELWDSFGQDFTYPGNLNLPAYVEEYFEEETPPTKAFNSDVMPGTVQCLPSPGIKIIYTTNLIQNHIL